MYFLCRLTALAILVLVSHMLACLLAFALSKVRDKERLHERPNSFPVVLNHISITSPASQLQINKKREMCILALLESTFYIYIYIVIESCVLLSILFLCFLSIVKVHPFLLWLHKWESKPGVLKTMYSHLFAQKSFFYLYYIL